VARKKSGGGCFLVLLLVLAGGWLARDSIGHWLAGVEFGAGSVPTERLADSAEDRVERLVRNGLNNSVRFSEAELQSLLTYRAAPFLPAGIEQPRIDVQDSVIVISALVLSGHMTDGSVPDGLRPMLADSSLVTAVLVPSVDRPGQLSVDIRSLQIGDLVVPSFLLPMIVDGLVLDGFKTSGGTIVVPIPNEVVAVRIEGEDIVMEPAADRD